MFELIYPAAPAIILPLPSIDNPGDSPRKAGEMVPVVEENEACGRTVPPEERP